MGDRDLFLKLLIGVTRIFHWKSELMFKNFALGSLLSGKSE
jgi:hypothetical protein